MMTLEQLERWRAAFNEGYGWGDMGGVEARKQTNALCDLAKLALSPPSDVAGLVSELQEQHSMQNGDMDSIIAYAEYSNRVRRKAADALLSLSARIRGLVEENGELREALKPFAKCVGRWMGNFNNERYVDLTVTNFNADEVYNLKVGDFIEAEIVLGRTSTGART